jgi:hypothetical protein
MIRILFEKWLAGVMPMPISWNHQSTKHGGPSDDLAKNAIPPDMVCGLPGIG